MLLGHTINLTDEKFSEYMKNVEKWDNELGTEKHTILSTILYANNSTSAVRVKGKFHSFYM